MRGKPERDSSSLGVMRWGLNVARKLFHPRRRRRRRRHPPGPMVLVKDWLRKDWLRRKLAGGGHKNVIYLRHSMPYHIRAMDLLLKSNGPTT